MIGLVVFCALAWFGIALVAVEIVHALTAAPTRQPFL